MYTMTINIIQPYILSMAVSGSPGGRDYIIPQLAVYTTYILPIGGLYNPYHLLGEPETAIDP